MNIEAEMLDEMVKDKKFVKFLLSEFGTRQKAYSIPKAFSSIKN